MTERNLISPIEALEFLSRGDERYRWAADVAIVHALRDIAEELRRIRVILHHEFVPHISLTRITIMPKTVAPGQTATAHITAAKSDGSTYTITTADSVSLAAAVPGDVTFGAPTFNADGSCDIVVTAVNADPGDAITATVDGVTSQPDTLTISAPAPATVTVTLQ